MDNKLTARSGLHYAEVFEGNEAYKGLVSLGVQLEVETNKESPMHSDIIGTYVITPDNRDEVVERAQAGQRRSY